MNSIECFTALLESKNEETWRDSIFQMANSYGFEQSLIAVVPDQRTALDKAFLRSNYSAHWRSIYDSTQLVNIDPTVSHCVKRSTPLVWEPSTFIGKKQKEMYEEAAGHGLRSGITLPFHGASGELGILCFVSDVMPSNDFRRDVQHNMPALSMMRDFAFEASLRFIKPANHEPPPTLTLRQLECLKWSAAGKSSWETAKILRCSEATVNFHFFNIRRMFNATSRRQAVVKAIHCGLLKAH